MNNFILYLWQLPQNIIGLLVVLFTRAKNDGECYRTRYNMGVSLGNYIILSTWCKELKHEQGHQKQSLYLGWLYLLVIGLPSAIGCCLSFLFHWSSKKYYSQPWEKWADKLGGVNREY